MTRRDFKLAGLWGLISLCLWLLLAFTVQPPFVPGYHSGHYRTVLDADHNLIARINHPDIRAGRWLKEVPPLLRAAAVAAEDRRFYSHPGIDLLSLGRAWWQNWRQGEVVSGASTITMQLARLERPAARDYYNKLREVGRALWLELHYSKDDILTWYLNMAPFGGSLVGLSAASEFLFHKDPWRLSPAEAAALLALPQDPSRLLRPQNRARLLARRDHILRAMAEMGTLREAELAQALEEPLHIEAPPPAPLPAPHFSRALSRILPDDAPEEIVSYLNPAWQSRISYLVKNLCAHMVSQGLRQAAVVVLRNRDRAVMAWVGSADFDNPDSGQVDGVLSLRQPGSALKPFLYALALEQGYSLAQPLDDSPFLLNTADGTYRPRDYDGRYHGQVSLKTALASSLNLPALRLAYNISPAAVLDTLRSLGFTLPYSPQHYGPGLALGNGEVTLLALSNAYATLASQGLWQEPRLWQGQELSPRIQALSPQASALITHVLADDQARALGFGRNGILKLPFPAAVKTGTSQHHRDNWCVGYTKDYTVGVWAGNFSGQPMLGVSGVSGAAPLWRQVMLLVHENFYGSLPLDPPGIRRVKVCLDSGLNPGPNCPRTGEELAMRSLADCPLHEAEQKPLSSAALRLNNPAPGGVYALDPDISPERQALTCSLRGLPEDGEAAWFLNGRELAGQGRSYRLLLTPGHHTLAAESGGKRVEVSYTVLGGRENLCETAPF
jgi:penicillin-binding protein 1C